MKVLITGIAGFIGSRLAGWILKNVPGAEVVGVDDLSGGFRENIPKGAWWRRASLGGQHDCLSGLAPDYVFHAAAYAAEGLSPFARRYNYQNNVLATAEVVNACLNWPGVKRLVYFSSMAVYGEGDAPFSEDDRPAPIDPYGVAKLACEQDIRIAGVQHGLDWCVIRPHNVYGVGQSLWDKYRNVLGIWMARCLSGLPIQVYGDGSQRRAFSWIDDCLPSLWRAATAPEASRQTINLGGPEPISIERAARLFSAVVGGCEIVHTEPRHEVADAWSTVARSQRLLGYRATTPLADGLRRMWAWAQEEWPEHPERLRLPRGPRVEVPRGLYSFWSGQWADFQPSTLNPHPSTPKESHGSLQRFHTG